MECVSCLKTIGPDMLREVWKIVSDVCNGLMWVADRNQMYVWPIEVTMEELKPERTNLSRMLETTVGSMEEALLNNHWPLKDDATAWLENGRDAVDRAKHVLCDYQLGGPRDVLTTRERNARAINVLGHIKKLIVEGDKYRNGAFSDLAVVRGGGGNIQATETQAVLSFLKRRAGRLSLDARIQVLLTSSASLSQDASCTPSALQNQSYLGMNKISFKMLNGRIITHRLKPTESIHSVKAIIEVKEGIPIAQQRLVFNDEVLEDDRTLADYNIQNDSTVYVIHRSRGGGALSEDQESCDVENIELNGFIKYSSLARSKSYERVPVMIQVTAPRYTQRSRVPIDLVLVLDKSGSMMSESDIEQVKQGCKFVVHNLEARDRLSIVAVDSDAREIFRLRHMTDKAKRSANKLIGSLCAGGDNNIQDAMEVAYKILRDRQDKKQISIILLLTDKDVDEQRSAARFTYAQEYPATPIYAFGIGLKHNSRQLYTLATRVHGTYSFATENIDSIRDAMALCVGGLTSVVAQDVKISIQSAHGVKISDIICGGYDCSVMDGGKLGSITVNDLCGSEVKNFIVEVNVPAEAADMFDLKSKTTTLLSVTADYYCPVTRGRKETGQIDVSLRRPIWVMGQDCNISVEVASEVIRAKVFKGVNEIWSEVCASHTTATEDVVRKLDSLRKAFDNTKEVKAMKDRWDELAMDLDCMKQGGASECYTEAAGLPYMLSWLSSHQVQRAATLGSTSRSKWFNFRTTRMQNMIDSVDSAPSAFIE